MRHGEADLSDIYKAIEIAQSEQQNEGCEFLPAHLFKEQKSAGNRPKYQQTVRGYMSILKKRHFVGLVCRGRYGITIKGETWLQEYEV